MIIKRTGKCCDCQTPTSERREFVQSVELFGPQRPKGAITHELKTQIEEWRSKPIKCEAHR